MHMRALPLGRAFNISIVGVCLYLVANKKSAAPLAKGPSCDQSVSCHGCTEVMLHTHQTGELFAHERIQITLTRKRKGNMFTLKFALPIRSEVVRSESKGGLTRVR